MLSRIYSLEATRPSAGELAELAGLVAPGTPLYLSRVDTHTLHDHADTVAAVRRAGLEPVAHVAARRLVSAAELAEFLARVRGDADMRRLLVIAGDRAAAAGPYDDALSLITRGGLREAGIEEVGIAGHPEGHPVIPQQALDRAMADKIAAARDAGLRLHIVSQFSFAPERIVGWLRALRAKGIDAPVKIGMAGPTSLPSLLRYAKRCGVRASVQGLLSGAGAALIGHVGPERIVEALDHATGDLGDVAPHYFSFGGLVATARYARSTGRPAHGHAINQMN